MVVDHYNLPMQPDEWIERSRWGEFSYIARNKTSAILTVIIIGIVQQSGFKLCKDHGHSKSDAHKPLDPWNVDGDHYVNDGDP